MASLTQLNEDEVKEYQEVFNSFDRDHDGCVTITDLLSVAQQLGLPGNEKDLTALAGGDQVNVGRGKIDFATFVHLMLRTRRSGPEAKRRQEQEMRQAFKVFDRDGNGLIDEKELRTTMQNLGENLSANDVKAMIKAADRNGDGKIDYEEFIRMMYGK